MGHRGTVGALYQEGGTATLNDFIQAERYASCFDLAIGEN